MVDETRQPAGKAADLARVRDNQRRSRARRKEYLQELETKYRTCEQVGIGASAEIQAAARQVADENRRLRQILTKHGISADEFDGDSPSSSVASELEAMIGKKRNCGQDGIDCEQSLAKIREEYSSVPERGLRPLQMRASDRQLSPQSGYESSNGGAGVPSPLSSTFKQQQQQQSHPNYATPQSQNTRTESGYTQQPQYQPRAPSISLYGNYPDYPSSSISQQQQQQLPDHDFYPHPQNLDSYPSQNLDMDHHSQQNTSSSCRDIANAIRYVRPNLSQQELEREMGCQPGTDCHVPNYEAFDLMDRLSEGGAGARR
ncbi:hypothetical protein Slin15195_G106200 [Septoria linicola]|uniref:BZIP domain-containing protein n=1 Tax=Septoria linicola TaxID=215465 RepID=A0A9Q9EN10_9PEZI|nr:hypothetical protein Slin15195_G106200 [Septoria linicola]